MLVRNKRLNVEARLEFAEFLRNRFWNFVDQIELSHEFLPKEIEVSDNHHQESDKHDKIDHIRQRVPEIHRLFSRRCAVVWEIVELPN